MVLRGQLATLEPDKASQEEKDFTNVASTRYAAPGRQGSARVARLGMSNGLYVGPGKTLAVQRGDTVTFTAYAWLTAAATATTSRQTTQTARSTSSVVVLAAPLSALAVASLPPGAEPNSATGVKALPRLSVGVGIVLGGKRQVTASALGGTTQDGTGTSGNAQLHYIVKDKDGNVVREAYQNATPGAPGTWQPLQVGLRLEQGGTVELSVESDGASGPDVYFDDIEVKHTAGTIVQEQHQYAYGAPMLGLNYTVGSKSYRHGYQGQFAEQDEETGLDAFELRLYDSRIGRWTAPDPEGQFASPYVGMGNNPVSGTDPDGGWSSLASIGLGAAIGATVGGIAGYQQGGREGMWGGIAMGAVAGGIAGGIADWGLSNTSLSLPSISFPHISLPYFSFSNSAWMLYNGTSVTWYRGELGDTKHSVQSYPANSGALNQNASNQNTPETGPVPSETYTVNTKAVV